GFSNTTASGLGHAAQWSVTPQGVTVRDLGTLPGGTSSSAQGIDARGLVVGVGTTAAGATHAELWNP
ncbi:MAG TPA: HAF repeat-containing protein, partial [Candidatus Dormibacteraeota bacterium]|nr:HAF repeat-containing protein [Candidatus Dormibacteraeota bacterium]